MLDYSNDCLIMYFPKHIYDKQKVEPNMKYESQLRLMWWDAYQNLLLWS